MTEAKATTQPAVAQDDAFLCTASSNQQALWFIDRLLPGQATYNIATAFELRGAVRWDLIQKTIDLLTDRHESLRTSFASVDDIPMQVITPCVNVPLRHVDLTSAAEGADRARALIDEEARRPFDMSMGPLIRARGLSTSPSTHVLVIVVHHSISDGWSQAVFFNEFGHVYRALAAGREPELRPVAIQYADYCIWQEQRLSDKLVEQQLAYWRQALEGTQEGLELPGDKPRPAVPSRRGGCIWFEIDRRTTTRLTQFCRAEGVTTFAVLVAVLGVLLQRYTGRDDVTIGTPVAGRSRAELEGTVGLLTNTVAIRADLSGDPTFRELIGRTRQQALRSLQHQDVPFSRVVDALRPERSGQQNPLFSVMCAVQRVPDVLLDLGEVTATVVPVHSGTSKFDWLWEFQERGESCEASLEYSTALFSEAFASRATSHFLGLLGAALASPDSRLSSASLLSPGEVEQLRSWNDTFVPRPKGQTVLRMFDMQVAATPDRQAFRHGDEAATYRQLSDRAWQLARVLQGKGVTPGSRVGLLMQRSAGLLTTLLAVLRTGSAYVPMDPAYPSERLTSMADDAGLACIVTNDNDVADAWHDQRMLLRLDQCGDQLREVPPTPLAIEVSPASACYVMYTSGSTGRPKGVVMPHGPLANLVAWQVQRSAHGLTTLQFGSPSFDVSFQEVFATWLSGGCLIVLPEGAKRDPKAVLDLVEHERVERLFLPFVALETLAEAAVTAGRIPASLRDVVTAGEQLRVTPSVRQFFGALSECRLDNQYGPTETHVVTAFPLEGDVASWPELPPIGYPIANVRIHVLDRALTPAPVGIPGDIWIAGACLADGYWQQPEQTAERFRTLTIDGRDQRAYLSGDRGRYRADGSIEFLGRGDDQVKIRGFRVEPGEVEAAMERLPGVRQAAVVARPHAGTMRLLAFYIPAAALLDASSLRQALQRELPDYLVPTAFVALDALPTTPSGKVDRRRLPADLPTTPSGTDRTGVAPATETERTIADIWKAVLGLADVSVTDNFFDVGGHSLAALRVFSAIEAACGVALPLSVLLHAQTIERLARHVDEQKLPEAPPQWAPIVVINDANGPPIVGVHSLSGDVLEYRLIARHLSLNQRIIGLQAPLGPNEDIDTLFGSIEATAERYVRELRRVQPEGPYYLCGWSSGGSIALEMAQRLTRAGSTVALLAVIDSAPYLTGLPRRPLLSRLTMQLANIPGWIRDDLLATPPDMLLRRINHGLRTRFRRLIGMTRTAPTVRDVVDFPIRHGQWEHFAERHFQAFRRYVPSPYHGRVSLFSARTQPLTWWNEADAIWHHLAREVDVYTVPGTHFSIVREPHVKTLAEELTQAIRKAESSGSRAG